MENRVAKFWSHVRKTETCWLYESGSEDHGYRSTSWLGRRAYAHRIAYELCVGPIPPGMKIDHVAKRGCDHRNCVNPAHLEPVTQGENVRRGNTQRPNNGEQNRAKTHCPRGHLYDEANTYRPARGGRQCRACRIITHHPDIPDFPSTKTPDSDSNAS